MPLTDIFSSVHCSVHSGFFGTVWAIRLRAQQSVNHSTDFTAFTKRDKKELSFSDHRKLMRAIYCGNYKCVRDF
jgi:hypothetical protein